MPQLCFPYPGEFRVAVLLLILADEQLVDISGVIPAPAAAAIAHKDYILQPWTEAFNEHGIGDKPASIRGLRKLNARDLDARYRQRLRSVRACDNYLMRILDAVEARGQLNNTYIFITGDNGWGNGYHRWEQKAQPYDFAHRISLYAGGPGLSGGTERRLVSMVDIPCTIADLAGVELAKRDGISYLTGTRDACLYESRSGRTYDGVRTERYLYVERESGERELYDYVEHESAEHELYDHQNEQHELRNQLAEWGDYCPTADPQVVDDLQQQLRALQAV